MLSPIKSMLNWLVVIVVLLLSSCAHNQYSQARLVKAEPSRYTRELHLVKAVEDMHKLNDSLHDTIDDLKLERALDKNKVAVVDKEIMLLERRLYNLQLKYKESLRKLDELQQIEVLIKPRAKKEVQDGMAGSPVM